MNNGHHNVQIIDTYAEAFSMWCCRLIVTACDTYWANIAAQQATSYGTSIIGCDCEAGIEQSLTPHQTPDGRVGVSLLFFAIKSEALANAVVNRAGQCLMTTPTTAVFDGFDQLDQNQRKRVPLGDTISYFGDGFEKQVEHAGRNCWAIPVMDGTFHIEASMGMIKGVAGGNLLLCGKDQLTTLNAAKAAIDTIHKLPGVIAPFPGGIVRCGSKVGALSNPNMLASTNHAYCPTLTNPSESQLPKGTHAVYELIFDGIDLPAVETAMKTAINTAIKHDLIAITAGNYQGKLGKYKIDLHKRCD